MPVMSQFYNQSSSSQTTSSNIQIHRGVRVTSGSSIEFSSIPRYCILCSHDNDIHLIGAGSYYKYNYATNSCSRITSSLGFNVNILSRMAYYQDKVYVIGNDNTYPYNKQFYSIDGSIITKLGDFPSTAVGGYLLTVGNAMYYLGCNVTEYMHECWKYQNGTWTQTASIPYGYKRLSACVHNNELHIFLYNVETDPYLSNTIQTVAHYYMRDGDTWWNIDNSITNEYVGEPYFINDDLWFINTDTWAFVQMYHYNRDTLEKVQCPNYKLNGGITTTIDGHIHLLYLQGGGNHSIITPTINVQLPVGSIIYTNDTALTSNGVYNVTTSSSQEIDISDLDDIYATIVIGDNILYTKPASNGAFYGIKGSVVNGKRITKDGINYIEDKNRRVIVLN